MAPCVPSRPRDRAGLLSQRYGLRGWRRHAQQLFERTGQDRNRWALPLAAVFGLALAGWALGGAPTAWSLPVQEAFMVDGGAAATPEFLAVLVGLVMYTASFVAEVVRGGIQSVSHGQSEASAL